MLRSPLLKTTYRSALGTLALMALILLGPACAQAAPISNFDTPVVIGPTKAPGVWYTDRFRPAGFSSPAIAPDGRPGTLLHSISSADQNGSRPSGFNSPFYNTQGRSYDLPGGTKSLFVELYVPASWNSLNQNVSGSEGRLAGLWATGFDSLNVVSAFPIIEFNNNTDGSGADGFRIWDVNNGGFTPVAGFTGYDKWYELGFSYDPTGVTYFVNGSPVGFFADTDTQYLGNVILQGYNAGTSYDINWDNLNSTTSVVPEPASIALFGLTAAAGAFYGWRRRKLTPAV